MPETFTEQDFAPAAPVAKPKFTEADFAPQGVAAPMFRQQTPAEVIAHYSPPARNPSAPAVPAFGPLDFMGKPDDVVKRVESDPHYWPDDDELRAYFTAKDAKPTRVEDVVQAGLSGFGNMLQKAVDVAKSSPELFMSKAPLNRAVGTVVESATRGTFDLGRSARPLIDKWAETFVDESEGEFYQRKAAEFRIEDPSFNPPKELLAVWRRQWEREAFERRAERFRLNRALDQVRDEAATGKRQLAESFNVGEPAPTLTEPLSNFLGLEDVATFGAGAVAEQALRSATRRAAAGAVTGTGKTAEAVGTGLTAVGTVPERAAAAVTRAVTGSEEAAEAARKTVSGGGAGLAVAPGVGVSIPGVTPVAQVATGAKAAGAALEAGGEAAQAVGRVIESGPSRVGALERISKDGTAPLWMRRAAANVAVLDPVIKEAVGATGAAGRGAAGGAGVGALLGYGLSGGDIEAAAAGAGGGIVQGTAGGLFNRVATRTARSNADAEADLSRWLSDKSVDEIENINALHLTREQALKVADVERWARGVINQEGGDVQFRYLNDAQFRKQFGSSQKGAELVEGDRPMVFVNTGFRGPRSMFHEVFHAAEDLDAFDPQRIELNRRLFTETAPDGSVLSKGLFDAADIAAFEQSYRERLGPALAAWDAQPAPDRLAKIRKEVRAESFASMVSGASGRQILTGASGWRQRLADAMLLADNASSLGRMRQFLEAAGVEFKASGDPSELFFKNGRPITNTPEVDAALRDYMRAKRRVVDRLVAGDDDSPAVAFDERSIRSNPELARSLAAQHPDWDGWQKNPDGSVKIVGGDPDAAAKAATARDALTRSAEAEVELARIEAERTAAETRATQAEQRAATSSDAARTELGRAQARLETARAKQARNEAKEAQTRARDFRAEVNRVKREAAERRKAADAAALLRGQPVLATEKEIRRIQTQRVEGMLSALKSAPDIGEPGVVRDQGNGHWKGQRFSEAQLRALEALPDDVLAPSMKQRIRQLNDLASRPSGQIVIDYNAALKNRRYSSGISPTTRIAVPISIDISKAGNFLMETLDVTHFMRKLRNWQSTKPRAFDAWGGDVNGFMRDVFKYLDNHQRGLPGATDMDADAATAIAKRNVIKDLFNVGGPGALSETGGAPISTKGEKDNLIRSRRFDRIQRITPGEGSPFPIDYYKQKANFQPPSSEPVTMESLLKGLPQDRDARREMFAQRLAVAFPRVPMEPAKPGTRPYGKFVGEMKVQSDLRAWETSNGGDLYKTGPDEWRVFDVEYGKLRAQSRPLKRQEIAIWGDLRLSGSQSVRFYRFNLPPDATATSEPTSAKPTAPPPNFLPSHPAEVARVTRDQAVVDFAREFGVPLGTARSLVLPALDRLHAAQPARLGARDRASTAAMALRDLTHREREPLQQALRNGRLKAARDLLK